MIINKHKKKGQDQTIACYWNLLQAPFDYEVRYKGVNSSSQNCKPCFSPNSARSLRRTVGHITEFVRVNRRFRLEPVLASNRAVP